ncbi:MAG: DegQ family serine endoprotease [Gammaproteobacteria bacterium]|nr:DegQ family serine endoprotease [Gammaproteobacteria bacterium]
MLHSNIHARLFLILLFTLTFFSQPVFAQGLPDFTEMVEAASPAIVNISTTQKVKRSNKHLPFEIPDMPENGPFKDFMDKFFRQDEDGIEEHDVASLGSGFIITNDGYIMTNNHVVKDADEIIVRLSDRREFKAEVIGTDHYSDIALLKIDASNLPMVKIGDSNKLKVGEWVLAIGSPFGFEHSVTAGIVSAKGRSLPRENYVPFIQTDVAINPGNSGGPLFNMDGEVVGVNSQIYSRTGGFMGLSFAVPITMAMNVVDQIRNKGRVTRGWLGVLIQDVTRELAESFGMKQPKGALVAKVMSDSPAEKAGFKTGDIILSFDGKSIPRSSDLPPMVGRSEVGNQYKVKILRNGKYKTLTVKIAELPEEDETVADTSPSKESSESVLGLMVTKVPDEVRKALEQDEGGVFVQQVEKGAALRAGVRRGDVIMMINNVDIKDVNQFKKLVKDLPEGKSIPLLVQRRNGPIFLAMKIEKD